MAIQTVGVIGAGVIGAGVAQALAETGHRVVLVDLSCDQLERAKREMKRQARLTRLLRKAAHPPRIDDPTRQVRFSTLQSEKLRRRATSERRSRRRTAAWG